MAAQAGRARNVLPRTRGVEGGPRHSRSRELMRVAFLVADLGRSGGMAVIRTFAAHLREREGVDCELVVCAQPAGRAPVDGGKVPVRWLSDVRETPIDVAIATWWTTTESLWDLRASRRAVLIQSVEPRYYREGAYPDRLGAEAVFDLPVHWLAVSEHLHRLVTEVRPDA